MARGGARQPWALSAAGQHSAAQKLYPNAHVGPLLTVNHWLTYADECCERDWRLELRKGSSDFPKRQLGISDVEWPANDPGLADSTSTRLKKGHLAELNSDLGVASDGPSKVLTIITAKLDAADRMLLLACLRITSTVVRR